MLSAFRKYRDLEAREAALEQRKRELDMEVNRRVADIVTQLDPYEPFLKRFHGVFAAEYAKPEDDLNERDKVQLFQSAAGWNHDPYFKHVIEWLQNVQGNNTLRRAVTDEQWFFGRCAVIMLELFSKEVGRLASRYEDMVRKKESEWDDTLLVD